MVTLIEAKQYLQLTGSTYDALLTSYIGYITATIETYLNNHITPLISVTSKRILNVNDNYVYDIGAFPVSGVILTNNGIPLIENETYFVDYESGLINFAGYPSFYSDTYLLNYTIGYAVEDVPQDLKFVALKLIKSLFDSNSSSSNSGSGLKEVKSKKIGDFAVTYAGSTETTSQYSIVDTALMANKSVLDKYKRIFLFG